MVKRKRHQQQSRCAEMDRGMDQEPYLENGGKVIMLVPDIKEKQLVEPLQSGHKLTCSTPEVTLLCTQCFYAGIGG